MLGTNTVKVSQVCNDLNVCDVSLSLRGTSLKRKTHVVSAGEEQGCFCQEVAYETIVMTKRTASALTVVDGTPTGDVTDIRNANDGNFLTIQEQVGPPGFDLIVDFVGITAFRFVRVLASYVGAVTHGVGLQIYNWRLARWDTNSDVKHNYADVSTPDAYIIGNESFYIPKSDDYIGTGANSGRVRIRFIHGPSGNPTHRFYVDAVELY